MISNPPMMISNLSELVPQVVKLQKKPVKMVSQHHVKNHQPNMKDPLKLSKKSQNSNHPNSLNNHTTKQPSPDKSLLKNNTYHSSNLTDMECGITSDSDIQSD